MRVLGISVQKYADRAARADNDRGNEGELDGTMPSFASTTAVVPNSRYALEPLG